MGRGWRWPRGLLPARATVCIVVCGAVHTLACGAVHTGVRATKEGYAYAGRVTFDARLPTSRGVSEAVSPRPGRHLRVVLLHRSGRALAAGWTGEDGAFALTSPTPAHRIRVDAQAHDAGQEISVTTDGAGRDVHGLTFALDRAPASLDVHITDRKSQAGAFHVLDTVLRGLRAARRWSGRSLAPLFVYWVRGETREWSYYRGERPAGSGRFSLELLGGEPGQRSTTDTDEHDEAIILHELGHFVMDQLSGDSSGGGLHPAGALLDPGLAWEEGRATWFAAAVARAPRYRDTIGMEPWGRLRVDLDLEHAPEHTVRGLGSEESVARILWDLTDGAAGLPDDDADGVALAPALVLRAMMRQVEVEEGSYPCLASFLAYLVEQRLVTAAALARMLARSGEPTALLSRRRTPWPIPLRVGEAVAGKIDSLTQPAPYGGTNLPGTGLGAVHTYRMRIGRPGLMRVRMTILGSGLAADHQDLDLTLYDLRSHPLQQSAGQMRDETLVQVVEPGYLVVRVFDGGHPARVGYRLEAFLQARR